MENRYESFIGSFKLETSTCVVLEAKFAKHDVAWYLEDGTKDPPAVRELGRKRLRVLDGVGRYNQAEVRSHKI